MFCIKASVTRYNVQKIHLSESKWNVDNVLSGNATSNHFRSMKIVPDCRNSYESA